MRKILFVCVHNAGRSQMAEAFFNLYTSGKAKGLSAGTQPAQKVNPVVIEAMKEVGIDISKNKPKVLTLEMVKKANKMITMGCGAEAHAVCPASFVPTEDWQLDDPEGKPMARVREIREEIRNRVAGLIKELGDEKSDRENNIKTR